jgi:hypothetical protein
MLTRARVVVLALVVLWLAGCGPSVPAPTGFADFTWGTTDEDMNKRLFSLNPSCRWAGTRGDMTISCAQELGGREYVAVFYFDDRRFSAYTLAVGRQRASELREIARLKFGNGDAWTWGPTSARFIEQCTAESACLRVRSEIYEKARAAERASDAEQAKAAAKRL